MVSGERRREAIAKQRKKLSNYMSLLGKVCKYLCISYTHATHSSCWQLHHGEWHLYLEALSQVARVEVAGYFFKGKASESEGGKYTTLG